MIPTALALLLKWGPSVVALIEALEQGKLTHDSLLKFLEKGMVAASDVDMAIEFRGQTP